MISNLKWTPAAGGGTQTIQFKPNNTTDWITYQTLGPAASSIGVTGLNYNTLYDFQVVNNCPTGSTTFVTGQDIVIQCPTLLITPSDTIANIQFFDLGGTIDTYTIQLLDSTSVTVLQTKVLNGPFSPMITTQFTGLTALTSYTVRTIPSSGAFSKANCATVSTTTSNTPTCPAPAGGSVAWAGTTATFTWIAQAGVLAQEVWYGRRTDVGSTLPPASGWNQGANLYSATAASATLVNLDVNTSYQFLVRSDCSSGSSPWTAVTAYNLVCPAITTVNHTTSVDVTLQTLNSVELAKIVYSVVLQIIDPSTATVLNSVSFIGAGIQPVLNQTFTGLTASTPYIISVGYTLSPTGTVTACGTKALNTSTLAPCTALTTTITNITGGGFTVNVSALQAGDTWDLSIDGGSTFPITGLTGTPYVFSGAAGTYSVVTRRNCSAGNTGTSSPQSVTVITTITGTISLNSNKNTIGRLTSSGSMYLVFNFAQPTPAVLTFNFAATRLMGTTPECLISNGVFLYTPGIPNQNTCAGYPNGLQGSTNPLGYPYVVTVPAGVTSFNTSPTLIDTALPSVTGWLNDQTWTDVYVKIITPVNYSPNFTIVSGANIPANTITIHNLI